ncbi:hypothetical protein M407DRAFT_9135 [Tulasnella calospora MUT 4182]|uniref:Uncharacterized protein n=1 Tax=Tulasnella calospora MUT 4182 TaxID=1051891 RepID=A0A0C3LRP8_9AGAM|nr:hypothetical protein M407DRAFT_9135 [Tulasnella calospora MUT 4182]
MPGQSARYRKQTEAQPHICGRKKQKVKDLKLRQPLPERGPTERKRQRDQKQDEVDSGRKKPRVTAQAKSQLPSALSDSHSRRTLPGTPAVNALARVTVQSPDIDRSPGAKLVVDDTPPRDYPSEAAIAGPSATAQPLARIPKTVAVPNSLPDEINFGGIHSVENTEVSFSLRMIYDGSTYKMFIVGRDDGCDIRISGPGIAEQNIVLKVVVDGLCHKLHDQILVPNGGQIRFGSGGWFAYRAACFSDLYEVQAPIYGGRGMKNEFKRAASQASWR